ncbi:hypothetical protein ACTXT7_003358 [Hymenolepis weldensis]
MENTQTSIAVLLGFWFQAGKVHLSCIGVILQETIDKLWRVLRTAEASLNEAKITLHALSTCQISHPGCPTLIADLIPLASTHHLFQQQANCTGISVALTGIITDVLIRNQLPTPLSTVAATYLLLIATKSASEVCLFPMVVTISQMQTLSLLALPILLATHVLGNPVSLDLENRYKQEIFPHNGPLKNSLNDNLLVRHSFQDDNARISFSLALKEPPDNDDSPFMESIKALVIAETWVSNMSKFEDAFLQWQDSSRILAGQLFNHDQLLHIDSTFAQSHDDQIEVYQKFQECLRLYTKKGFLDLLLESLPHFI